jgi:hypothetical protein
MSIAHLIGGLLLPYGYQQSEVSVMSMATRFFTYLGIQMCGLVYLFGFIKGLILSFILAVAYITIKYVIWKRMLGVFEDSGWTDVFRSGIYNYLIFLTAALEFFMIFGLMWFLACLGSM